MAATLELRRQATIAELHRRTFAIEVDGHEVGSIEMHGSVEGTIEPGNHVLRVRQGRFSSRYVPFDIANDEVATFRCNGARIWPIWLATFIWPSRALTLHRE